MRQPAEAAGQVVETLNGTRLPEQPKKKSAFRPDKLTAIRKVRYPDRFLFFDSESWIPSKVDEHTVNWLGGEVVPETQSPHVPRLVCAQQWERRADTGQLAPVDMFYKDNLDDKTEEPKLLPRVMFPSPDKHEDAPTFHWLAEKRELSMEMRRRFWKAVTYAATHYASRAEEKQSGKSRHHAMLYIIGHNIGYDVRALSGLTILPELGWIMERAYDKGTTFIWKGERKGRRIQFVSSTNFFPAMPLKTIGESFGIEKLDMEDFNTEDVQRLMTYCRRDVEIVQHCILWIMDRLEHGAPDGSGGPLGPWKLTISSIAFSVWRYRFMPVEIELKTPPEETVLAREAYLGGHTEPFWIGTFDAPIRDCDVNTLYGWVMLTKDLPFKLDKLYKDGEISPGELALAVDEGEPIIARVEIEIDDERNRAIPRRGDKLLFPWGKFSTTLCTPELQLVNKYGRITRVHAAARYETAPLFKSYMKWVVEGRLDAQRKGLTALRDFQKRMGNHVYGKLGQKAEEWVRVRDPLPGEKFERLTIVNADDPSLPVTTREILPTGVYEFNGVTTESTYSFVAAAAFITSWARRRLWDLKVIAEGTDGEHHVLYCDTDSLFVDETGYDNLVRANMVNDLEAGKMKVEWTARRVMVRGNKAYIAEQAHPPHDAKSRKWTHCFEGSDLSQPHYGLHEKFKGVPGDAPKVMTPEGPRRIVELWPKTNGLLKDHDLANFRNHVILKKDDVTYDKARVSPLGFGWVVGWHLPQEAEKAGLGKPVAVVEVGR